MYGCRICVVGRRGSLWYEPPGGACTEVLTLVYFDATDYRHYSSTRPLAPLPPGAGDAAAHAVDSRDVVGTDGCDAPPRPSAPPPPGADDAARAVAGSSVLRDWLDDSDDIGPGSLVQSLQHVDDPDGAPLILRGGLQRSEVDRFYQVLVAVRDRMRSVLRWVQSPATGTAGRVSGRIVHFCGVSYRAPDGVFTAVSTGVVAIVVATSILAVVPFRINNIARETRTDWFVSCNAVWQLRRRDLKYSVMCLQRGTRNTHLRPRILHAYTAC